MTYDAVVIGAGPAGYVCAIRLGQLGLKAAVVEAGELGGVCLNVGCIPSKALISAGRLLHRAEKAAAMGLSFGRAEVDLPKLIAWKDGIVQRLTGGVRTLLEKNGVEIVRGRARLAGEGLVEVETDGGPRRLETKHAVLATGSRPIEIPGFAFDGEQVWSSTEALAPRELPRRMLVIGGGVIGLELGLVYHNLGTEIRIVEFMDRVLPGLDPDLSKEMARALKKRKIPVHLGARAQGFEETKDGLAVSVETKDGTVETFTCDVVLSAVGRRPNSEGLGLEEVGVRCDDKGFVVVDRRRRTTAPWVYAIGDLTGQPMLAHKGSAEGLAAAAAIAGDEGAAFDPAGIPGVVFTDPEIATVGYSEEEAQAAGFTPVTGRFPFRASGRAMSLLETDGWIKVVADRASDKILGIHMIGPEVTELVGEATLALEAGVTAEDLALTIHAHPTLGEALMEAAEAVHGKAVHVLN